MIYCTISGRTRICSQFAEPMNLIERREYIATAAPGNPAAWVRLFGEEFRALHREIDIDGRGDA